MSTPGIDSGSTDESSSARPPTGNSFLGDVRVNFTRWNRKAIRNPTAFLLEIVIGLFSLVLFAAVFGDVGAFALAEAGYGDVDYVTYLVPAVLMQATIGSSFNSGIGLVGDVDSGMFEKTTVSPMSWTAVFAGKAASELLRIVLQVGAVLALAVAMGGTIETGLPGAVAVVAVCLPVAVLFMAISNVVGMLARDDEVLNAATMLFMFPLLFLSPAFIPMSSDIELLATVNPVTYGVDAVRALVLGEDVMTVLDVTAFGGVWNTLVPALAILVALDLVFGALAVRLLGRASSADAD
jgi:ABC-2 type transport system permease protein